jgi:DNA-binding NtrC family response regulator
VRNAAKLLGLGQATVYRKIKRYGIHPRDYGHSAGETPELAASSDD